MAKSDKVVKRGVYLYLDGSEIKNDIKSVEAEMKGLISAQKKMTIGSEEYVRTAQKIRSLKGIISEHNAQLREVDTNVKKNTLSIGKLADGFNRFFGMIGAGVAALTGFTLAIRSLRDEKNKLEESQAGLKALTGLDDESISWLTGQAKILSTTMTKEGLRVRQSANEILDAYMLIGSAKPELLGNKEALASVTEEAMRLQAAAKDITLNEAVDALTLSLNQYSEGADKAAQFTNVLAAGSQAGSANIASEAKAIRVAGVAAASANTSIEQTVGLIQTLAYRGIKDEIAGTGLKKFFLTLQTGSDDTNPKIVGLTTALDNLQKKQMDAAAIKKMFGEEGYNVASVLISETAQVKEFTKAVTDTNIATEQAAINSNTAAAKLAQAKNELKLAGIELADRLNPAISVSTNMVTNLIKYLPGLIDWFKEWGSTIALSLAPVLLYNGAIKLMNAYHVIANGLRTVSTTLIILHTAAVANSTGNLVRYNTAMSAYNLMLNTNSRLVKFCTGLTYLFAAAKATLAGNTVKAGIAMKAFQALGMTNVFVAIATAVLAAGIAIYKYATRTTEAQKAVNEFLAESAKERDELKKLTDAAQRAGDGTERRKQLIDEINSKYGQYLTNLLDEKSSLNDIKRAYNEINTAMSQNIAKKILDEKTEKISRESMNNKISQMNDIREILSANLPKSQVIEITQKIDEVTKKNIEAGKSAGYVAKSLFYGIKQLYFQGSGLSIGMEDELKRYAEIVASEYGKVKEIKDEMAAYLPDGNNGYESPELEVTAKDLSKKNNGGSGSGDDKKKKDIFLKVESEYNKKREELKKKYLSGEIKTQEEYNRKAEELELQLLNDKLKVAGVEPAEREKITQQILDAKIKTMQELAKLDESFYVSPEEKNRRELEQVQKKYDGIRQIIEKAYSMGIIPTIEEKNKILANIDAKQAEESKKANEVIAEDRLKKKDEALAKEVLLLQERRIAERMTDKQYQEEFKKLNLEYIAEKLRIVGLSEEQITELKKQGLVIQLDDLNNSLQEEKELRSNQVELVKGIVDEFVDTVEELFSNSEATFKDYMKGILLMSLNVLEKVVDMTVIEVTIKSIKDGLVGIALGAAKIAAIKLAFAGARALVNNFYDGGYTPGGAWDKPQGVVHSNEFVSNRFAVSNPNLRPVFDLIDYAQKSNSVANLTGEDIAAVLPSSGRTRRTNPPDSSGQLHNGGTPDNAALMAMIYECTQTMRTVKQRFDKPILSETYATGKRGTMEAEKLVERMESNVSRNSLKQ